MDLKELRRNWETFGRTDPFGSILTTGPADGGEWTPEDFFRTGDKLIAEAMACLEGLEAPPPRRTALDFGCGAGRLTQSLCRYFETCHGIDIAPSMIERAHAYNRFPDRCHYAVNDAPDLRLFADGTFDFIYTHIVLQHMRPEYCEGYLREFVRLLSPTGVMMFQLPSEPLPALPEASRSDQSALDRALPAHAFRARVVAPGNSLEVHPGQRLKVPATIVNLSAISWPALGLPDQRYRIQLGNHWLDGQLTLLARDDGRAPLPRDLLPAHEVAVTLTVTCPTQPGLYFLELDLVQEGVTWFAERGSSSALVRVEVRTPRELAASEGDAEAAAGESAAPPRMEMYGTPPERVRELLSTFGGELLDLREDDASTGWRAFRYCARRAR